MIELIIISILVFISYLIMWLFFDDFKSYSNYGLINKYFDENCDLIMNFYMLNNGIRDALTNNIRINPKQFHEIRQACATYVWENTPKWLQKKLNGYYSSEQITNMLLIKVDSRMSEIYVYDNEAPEILTADKLLTYREDNILEETEKKVKVV